MQETRFNSWVGKIHWRKKSLPSLVFLGFPDGSAGKESTCNAGDLGLIPGLERSPGEEKGYPLQYSGLENSMGSLGSQRVGHDQATFTVTLIFLGSNDALKVSIGDKRSGLVHWEDPEELGGEGGGRGGSGWGIHVSPWLIHVNV